MVVLAEALDVVIVQVVLVLALAAPAFAQGGGMSAPSLPDNSPLLAGIPSGTLTAEPVMLSIGDVVRRALEHNLGLHTSEARIAQLNGERRVSLSDVLPNLSARLSEMRQRTSLEAFGLTVTDFPRLIGPFNVFDARLHLTQSLFDARALHEVRAAGHDVAAAKHTYKSRRDLVSLVAANMYLEVVRAASRAESVRAQRATADALYSQALTMKQGGMLAGIDVLRAEVRLSTERQRVTSAQNDLEKLKLQLARLIGLPLGQPFAVTAQFPDVAVPDITLEDALARAYRERPDYLGALERVEAAAATRKSASAEALPSARLTAEYGAIGLTPSRMLPTFAVAGTVVVPLFQGGRTQGRLMSTDAELRSRQAEADSLRADIYYEIRTAFLDMQSSNEALQVATRGRELAARQLTQARDRFAAGVASSVEVVQAQEAMALADDQFIDGRYGYLLSKAMLAGSLGIAEEAVQRYLGGSSR